MWIWVAYFILIDYFYSKVSIFRSQNSEHVANVFEGAMFVRTVVLLLICSLLGVSFGAPDWYKCDETNCKAPDCRCGSIAPPNGLTPETTPQFILVTHDDAINPFSNKVVRSVIDAHTNPNGCNVPATWYTLQQGSDCATIKKLYDENSEIALHTVNHNRLYPNYPGGKSALLQEMFGVRKWLNEECGIPLEDLVGFRTPYLVSNPQTRQAMFDEKLLYDSSMIQAFSQGDPMSNQPGQRVFPFTMDHGIPINCNWNYPDGQCNETTENYPGLWEAPLWELQNAAGDHLFSMDPEGDVFNIYKENIDMNYNNNRAPFGVFLHAPWFTDKNTRALNQFMDYAMSLPDVWAITTRQLIEWMKDPVPASQMGEWLKCKPVTLTAPLGDVRCQSYTVQSGDTAYNVATKFAVLLDDFLLANPSIGSGTTMSVGSQVRIPPWGDDCIGDAVKQVTGPGQVQSDASSVQGESKDCKLHNVIPKDTWTSVAASYNVAEQDLRSANTDVPGDVISPGVTLRIPPYKETCPVVINEIRPTLIGPSTTPPVYDEDPPSTGLRVNMKIYGRTKTELQLNLEDSFKATVGRAIGVNPTDIEIVNMTSLNLAAGLRRLMQDDRALVEVEMTIANTSPLRAFANYTRDLSLDSKFEKELQAFGMEQESAPLIRIIQNGVTMDVDASNVPDLGEAMPTPTQVIPNNNTGATGEATPANDTSGSSSGLSTGAIIGIAVGAGVAVILAIVVFVIVARRKKASNAQNSSKTYSVDSEDSNSSPKSDPIDQKI